MLQRLLISIFLLFFVAACGIGAKKKRAQQRDQDQDLHQLIIHQMALEQAVQMILII